VDTRTGEVFPLDATGRLARDERRYATEREYAAAMGRKLDAEENGALTPISDRVARLLDAARQQGTT
jgi:hypothetical protein